MVVDSIIHVARRGWKEAKSAAQPQNWANHRLFITCLVALSVDQCLEGTFSDAARWYLPFASS